MLFATFGLAPGTGLRESDDGGQTWSTDLQATGYTERPVWVRTRRAIDQNPAHFDLYFPGRRVTCSNSAGGPRCPSNAGETWSRVPASTLNHDLSSLAFDPTGNCPLLMTGDYGVYRAATTPPPCGADANWTHVGRASTGLGSLQIFQVAGQLHYPITGEGVFISGYTNLFIGTMDNWLWANYDAGGPGWQGFGIEGSYLQTLYQAPIAAATDLQLTYMDFGFGPAARKIIPNIRSGTWSAPSQWTAATPPGNATAPVLISAHTYVQWSSNTLFLTTDGGGHLVSAWGPPWRSKRPAEHQCVRFKPGDPDDRRTGIIRVCGRQQRQQRVGVDNQSLPNHHSASARGAHTRRRQQSGIQQRATRHHGQLLRVW